MKRERHVISTPADVQSQLSGKNVFTVVGMKHGYWHIKLSDESSYFCTFNTPWGRKRFLRMPFGIWSASEIMQKRNEETIGDSQGVHVIVDDLINILNKVLQRARDKGVKFKSDKIQFKISDQRMSPHYSACLVWSNTWHSIFPLNHWGTAKERCRMVMASIAWQSTWQSQGCANHQTSTFYYLTQPFTTLADASQSGLGACILRKGKSAAYASRAMTPSRAQLCSDRKGDVGNLIRDI